MIPAIILVVMYLVTSVFTLMTIKTDEMWAAAPRFFLGAALMGWAIFYILIDTLSFDALRLMSRYLHVPLVTAIFLIVWGRWYAHR